MWHQQNQLVYNYSDGAQFGAGGNELKIGDFRNSTTNDSINSSDACKLKRQSSVFNDSDYEEVVEEMDAVIREAEMNGSQQFDDIESGVESKRSSATSGVESSNEVDKDVEEIEKEVEEEAVVSKYDNVDIAKILHTRKRIHQTFNQPSESSSLTQENKTTQQQQQISNKKKSMSKFTKRYTSYGTLGRRSAAKTPASAPVENLNNRFSFGPLTDAGFSSPMNLTGSNGPSPGFSYNTVGRRRNKPVALSTSTYHEYGLADEANERWGITEPTSPTLPDGLEKPKRKRRWASFKRLVSSGGSESRERMKEEKKATIRLQRSENNKGPEFRDSLHSRELFGSSANNFSLAPSGTIDLTRMNHTPSRSRLPLDSDLFLAQSTQGLTLEERIMSDLKTEDPRQEEQQQKTGFSRKKSFKKMFKSFKLSGSTLQRKRKDKPEESSAKEF